MLKRNAPSVAKVEKLVVREGRDDYNAAAVRASLRVFLATGAALKIWGLVKERVLGRVERGYALSFFSVFWGGWVEGERG